ncbi:MAG: hypothetical protein KDC38_20005, partial [Planctomycetes bacterium]|nr:hypothetical protein [Planctomycetota bacterium]
MRRHLAFSSLLFSSLLTCFGTATTAGELYRLRIIAPPIVVPGQTIDVSVVADCTGYPDLTASAADLLGLGFTLSIPDELELASFSWGEGISQAANGDIDWWPAPSGTCLGAFAHDTRAITAG